MKMLLFKLFAVGVIVAGASNYLIYLKTGRMPLREWVMDLKNMKAPSASDLVDKVSDSAPIGDKKVKIYTWKDENGQVHYSNREEKLAKGAQEKMVSTHINTMPAAKPGASAGTTTTSGPEAQVDMDEQLSRLREARQAHDAQLQQ
jgi:hypothetical protein